ncbi:hypothetical protein Tco_0743506 [Tanacetum coccineum]
MLHSSFDMKDIGVADVILDIRIQKNSNRYILTQSLYIEKTLKKCGHYVIDQLRVAVSWKSSKHIVNTISTMEAEFVALDKATEEAEWIRSFLKCIPLWPKPVTAMCIHCDSMAALTRAKNHIYNGKILYTILDWHYLYEIDVWSHLWEPDG